mmetsp:Transcript_10158/g.26366  ORF Transcript_10158/g.26366 Transcript_10158/m.26366 type:complete len:200 (-) Transcript_10158:130-729(-)
MPPGRPRPSGSIAAKRCCSLPLGGFALGSNHLRTGLPLALALGPACGHLSTACLCLCYDHVQELLDRCIPDVRGRLRSVDLPRRVIFPAATLSITAHIVTDERAKVLLFPLPVNERVIAIRLSCSIPAHEPSISFSLARQRALSHGILRNLSNAHPLVAFFDARVTQSKEVALACAPLCEVFRAFATLAALLRLIQCRL